MENRIIGRYEGKESGPLLICLGGVHGNEPAGIIAITEVLHLLEIEPQANPEFIYRGHFVGIRGNLQALEEKKRYILRDLNRMLIEEENVNSRNNDPGTWTVEERERIELIDAIEDEVQKYKPVFTLILDLHTTTADGGIFTIAANDEMSQQLAIGLHAPVILGISEGLMGTTIQYFNKPDSNCYCIVFEAGRTDDPACVHRSVAAIVNCMRSIGSVEPRDVDHRHDGLLISLSIGLPKVMRLVFHYKIRPHEKFIMKPGYENFQKIKKGEEVAFNESGSIIAPADGLILMPKYQVQGEDGFFVMEIVE